MLARRQGRKAELMPPLASWLRRNPSSFLKLILLGFALVGLPLIIALINSALSIDRLADHSRKAVYQAAQIAHSSRALADEIAAMERAVRQTHILGDTSCWRVIFEPTINSKPLQQPFWNFRSTRNRKSC